MAASSPPRRFYDGARYQYDHSVGHQVYQLLQLMRREVEHRMAAHDLTDAQWRPLWLLAIGQANTPAELARELDMDPGALTRLLDRLVAKGLVARERSESDRRVVQLALTDAGRTVAGQVPHVLAGVNNDFLAGFTRAEWQQLLALIGRLAANGQALQAARTGAAA
ncbi:MAG: MarR family transcriptional regulator [Burkholderiaceae bacterium]|nr:MarR family transcriptional regulator [Burkholderiaceae bacterium]